MAKKKKLKHVINQTQIWLIEDTTPFHAINAQGLENIATHQYRPGQYTHLDNFLNPIWTFLTNLLPLSLSANMVTTLGGLHCAASYAVLWHYSPNIDKSVPDWAMAFAGYCTIMYYTLDCMDGKQSRRTGTSSPLGQLFDHGFDCICNLSHCASHGAYMMCGGTNWYLMLQTSLQFVFFCAQWEEYYTHVLPHACGKWMGVSEVNYGLGLLLIGNAFLDREKFFTKVVNVPFFERELELRQVLSLGWVALVVVLVSLSILRVVTHVKSNHTRISALSKLISPFLLVISPFLLPPSVTQTQTRYISLSAGLLFSFITKKMIVYSMAQMCFASFQFDCLLYFFFCLWIQMDENLTDEGAELGLKVASVLAAYRLLSWWSIVIDQICKRLDIYCFMIKKKDKVK